MKILLQILVALAGPSLLLGATAGWLLRPEPYEATPFVQELDARVKENDPEVVILGSSWAETNVDVDLLAESLQIPRKKIVTLSQPKSQPCIWYAMEKYRLFENGGRPKLIIVIASIRSLMTTVLPDSDLAELQQHFESPDAVLQQKIWKDSRSPMVSRLLSRRGYFRDTLLGWARGGLVGLWFHPKEGQTITELQTEAGGRVFASVEGNGNAIAQRFLPVVEQEQADTKTNKNPDPADTFLVDIAELARAHDSHLVVVLSATASFQKANNIMSPHIESRILQVANEESVGWIDLRKMEMDDSNFRADGGHMIPVGAKKFTESLVEKLDNINAFGEGPMRAATLPATIQRIERIGTAPTIRPTRKRLADPTNCKWSVDLDAWSFLGFRSLSTDLGVNGTPVIARRNGAVVPAGRGEALNQKCVPTFSFNGAKSLILLEPDVTVDEVEFGLDPAVPAADSASAWWVYPGTELRWNLSETPASGAFTVEITARTAGPTNTPAELVVDGVVTPLSEVAEGWGAQFQGTASGATHTVGLRSPADGPFLIIRRFSTDIGDQHTDLVTRPALRPVDVMQVAKPQNPPPAVSAGDYQKSGNLYAYTLPWSSNIGCTPFRVLEDGVSLPVNARVPQEKPQGRQVQQIADQLFFAPTGNIADHNYTVELTDDHICPTRGCKTCPKILWVYPGDHFEASLDNEFRKPAIGGIRALHLVGEAMTGGDPDATLQIQVTWKGDTILAANPRLADLPAGLDLVLDTFVSRGDPEALNISLSLGEKAAPLKLSIMATPL